MEREKLIERLKGYEWTDIEFKEARSDVPKNAYETVSAFANTEGGHLVFGVRQAGEDFEVIGVLSVDKVQGDFLTALRQQDKISSILDIGGELHQQGDADLLVFHIPEASREEKPVYLNGDIRRSFIRKGGSDVRCSANERDRFLIDAMAQRFDGQAVEMNPDTAFDTGSIEWYRKAYESRPGNRSYADLPDLNFLDEMGLLVEQDGRRIPTRAAILLFGQSVLPAIAASSGRRLPAFRLCSRPSGYRRPVDGSIGSGRKSDPNLAIPGRLVRALRRTSIPHRPCIATAGRYAARLPRLP